MTIWEELYAKVDQAKIAYTDVALERDEALEDLRVASGERDTARAAVVSLSSDLAKANIALLLEQQAHAATKAALVACQEGHEEPPPPPPPPPAERVLYGMSAPADQWTARLAEAGPVYARRIFGQVASPASRLATAAGELQTGRYPVLSFKLPSDDWAGATAGKYDTQLRALVTAIGELPGRVFVAIHHEPNDGGTGTAFASMQRRVLPILKTGRNIDTGVIMNGFIWSNLASGFSEDMLNQWLPQDVLDLCDVVGADFYEGGTPTNPGRERPDVKISLFCAWATRHNVKKLGIGEFNGHTASTLLDVADAVREDGRFKYACVFNSSENNRDGVDWVLTGTRLAAFKSIVADSRA